MGKNGHNNGHEKPVEADTWEEIKAMPSPREHWCPVHKKEFRKFEKDGRSWYSHREGDGWCKEQQAMKGVV